MAVIIKTRRVANPNRRRFAARMRRAGVTRNNKGRFVKVKKVRRRKRTNPVAKKRYRRTSARRTHRRSNSKRSTAKRSYRRRKQNPMLIELGMVNPRRRRNSVAKRKYRRAKANPRRRRASAVRVVRRRRRRAVASNPRRYRRRRRAVMANPVRHYRRRRRHAVHHRHRRRSNGYARRFNPFGTSTKDMVTMAGGILVGVAATKYLPSLIPASILPAGSSAWTGIVITGASAFAAGYLAHRFIGGSFANGIMAGGVALTLSQILNAVAPPSLSAQLALSGLGDIIPGNFVVPQNPVTSRPPVMVMPSSGGSGVGAFRGAFGGRR